MRIYTYVIDHDLGFAPNPFFGMCTLACCKPLIRKYAAEGDIVIGTGSRPNGLAGKLCYWMLIDEIVDFNEYWHRSEFLRKRPNLQGSLMSCYGDNIYSVGNSGVYQQANSFHSNPNGSAEPKNLSRDTATTSRVLIARDFCYLGREGISLPSNFGHFVHSTQGHRCRYPPADVASFSAWLQGMPQRGYVGRPANWPQSAI